MIEKFDHVHDVQEMYRKVLDSMSKPGTINNIKENLEKIDVYQNVSRESMGMAYLLLNTETSFYTEDKGVAKYLKLHTYAKDKDSSKADYIFVEGSKVSEEKLSTLIVDAKRGDLIDPHKGATLLVNVDSIDEGIKYKINGPGINGSKTIQLAGFGKQLIDARNEANSEYPMGIDMILIDKLGRVMALPRTTKIEVRI